MAIRRVPTACGDPPPQPGAPAHPDPEHAPVVSTLDRTHHRAWAIAQSKRLIERIERLRTGRAAS